LFPWIALVPLFLALSRLRPVVAALSALLWTVVGTFATAWWLPKMVANYLQVSLAVGWVVFLAISIGLACVYYAAFGAWLSWLVQRGKAFPLLIAAGWSVCEFVRANMFIGNPWALLGYSQVTQLTILQLADLAGPYGISIVIALVNVALASLVSAPL